MFRHRCAGWAWLGARRHRRRHPARLGGIAWRCLCFGRLQRHHRLCAVPAGPLVPAIRTVRGWPVMKRLLVVGGIAFLLVAPLLTSNAFFQHLMIMVLFWTLLGTSWNLLGGFAGQVSFGHATFLGVGAYTTMLLYLNLGVPPWFGVITGAALATLVALPIGLICFRLRGPYFSLATLAVAEIIRLIALNWESLTAGPMGVQITVMPTVQWFGQVINWESKSPFYYMVAVLTAFAMAVTWTVARSRLGAYLIAIREDTDSAEAAGIDTTRTKVIALALSAFLAGLAGGFYALYFRYIDPDAVFSIAISVEMVFIAVVG